MNRIVRGGGGAVRRLGPIDGASDGLDRDHARPAPAATTGAVRGFGTLYWRQPCTVPLGTAVRRCIRGDGGRRQMASASIGGRDGSRGWRSPQPHEFPPFYAWPPRPAAVLRWLLGFPGYLWPVNATWLVIALVTWFFLTPDLASMRSLAPGWIAFVFLRNLALTFLVYGGLHLYLHVLRCQGTEFQFDTRPFATRNPAFLFGDQVRDNMFWTLASGVTVWTAYEVVTLWAFANGLLPFADARGDSPWFVGLVVRRRGGARSAHSSSPLRLHPPPASLAPCLSLRPLPAPSQRQHRAMVRSRDASGGTPRVLLGRAHPVVGRAASGTCPVPASGRGVRAGAGALRLRTDSVRPRKGG